MPMMGRGSDTRMYSPRSESSHMYGSANEDGDKYSPTSPEDADKRREEKQRKDEERKSRLKDIKHIKIKPSQGLESGPKLPTEEGLDDGNKRDDEREISLQGGPAGSRGHLLDLATGAKTGTGSAMGTGNSAVRTGEPMDGAWSELLKQEEITPYDKPPFAYGVAPLEGISCPYCNNKLEGTYRELHTDDPSVEVFCPTCDIYQDGSVSSFDNSSLKLNPPNPDDTTVESLRENAQSYLREDLRTGEPMDDAWSELLKRDTPKTIQARRRREARQEFRPSTGQFKKPPGGQSGGAGATMRRFKARMRGIKGGKRTGLMKPHLSVEMSHRGIATKQPMSKDPQKYRQYMGQQEAQKILGGVRNTFSPHARHSARSFVAGPTGGGRLTGMLPGQAGQMRQPSLTRLGRPRRPRMPRMPRMPRPPMAPQMPMMPPAPPAPIMTSEDTPSQIMMSSDRTESDILKANRHARKLEMLELMRRLIDLQKKRNKLMKYVQGGGSAFENGHVPTHPAGVQQHEDEDEKNDGPTQNLETNSSRLGLDPAGHLSGKRGHFG